jgi:hypothetical protein
VSKNGLDYRCPIFVTLYEVRDKKFFRKIEICQKLLSFCAENCSIINAKKVHIEHLAQILNPKLEILSKFKLLKYEGSKRGKSMWFLEKNSYNLEGLSRVQLWLWVARE